VLLQTEQRHLLSYLIHETLILCSLWTNTWQFHETINQFRYRFWIKHHYIIPGMLRPFVCLPKRSAVTSSALVKASFVAAKTKSCNISISSGSTTSSLITTSKISLCPDTTTVTIPPPAVPSIFS